MEQESFIEQIVKTSKNKLLDINELKETRKPNILYGIGDYANTVFNFLKRHHIKIDFACIDGKYIDNVSSWNGLSVIDLEKLDKNLNEEYNIIIGFSKYKEAEARLNNLLKLNKSYFFDSISFFNFFNRDFIDQNLNSFVETYNYLSDEKSRSVFIAFINAKLKGKPDELYDLAEENQYFPNDIIKLSDHESFVDAGAYTGDTLLHFLKITDSKFEAYYAFEPDIRNFEILNKVTNEIKNQEIKIYNIGVSSAHNRLRFKSDDVNTVKSSFTNDGDILLEVDAIDNVLKGKNVTFIKMDIEGAEYEAIQGAKDIIREHKPKLAISMYHKQDDLIKLPQLIKSIRSDYKFYLRHHMHISQELVLYAI
jgi:FkbM family methyltransferase